MFHNLYWGSRTPAIKPLKNCLNSLVILDKQLADDDFFDENMYLAVKKFQLQSKSPYAHGIIDEYTLHNILIRLSSRRINKVLFRNALLKSMISTIKLPYDDEIHKGLTSVLAMAAGFSNKDAEKISTGNVRVDYNEKMQPMPAGFYDVASGANCERLKKWHFVTPERLKELDNVWRSDGNLSQLGTYLHSFQDSFSHKDLNPCIGQMGTRVDENGNVQRDSFNPFDTEIWHQVDDPSRRPQLAFEMAQQTYDILCNALELCKQKNKEITKTYIRTSWGSLKDDIWRFCAEKDPKKRKDMIVSLYTSLRNIQESFDRRKLN